MNTSLTQIALDGMVVGNIFDTVNNLTSEAMIALKGSSVHEELERDAADIKKAGGGKAEVSTIEGTTIIRVPRVN